MLRADNIGNCRLFLRHQHLTEGFIPFVQYINAYKEGHAFGDFDWLLSAKEGLFADGPTELMQVYEEVLNIYGLKTSLLTSDVNHPAASVKYFCLEGLILLREILMKCSLKNSRQQATIEFLFIITNYFKPKVLHDN